MATWASLTPAQQAQVQTYTDADLRAVVLGLARALAKTNISLIPQYLVSPSGLTSTIASPASDSVAGILATLGATEVVPNGSGLAGSGPILASKVATYSVSLNSMLATYFSAAVQQDYAQIVGSVNLIAGA
jgi:hypothetical protein